MGGRNTGLTLASKSELDIVAFGYNFVQSLVVT